MEPPPMSLFWMVSFTGNSFLFLSPFSLKTIPFPNRVGFYFFSYLPTQFLLWAVYMSASKHFSLHFLFFHVPICLSFRSFVFVFKFFKISFLSWLLFLKWAFPASFCLFLVFSKRQYNFNYKTLWKNVHPVCGVVIWTHNPFTSRHPWPLDQGSRHSLFLYIISLYFAIFEKW